MDVVTEPCPVMDRFILTPEDLKEYEQLQKTASERIVKGIVEDTDFSREVVDSNTRHGYYIVKG